MEEEIIDTIPNREREMAVERNPVGDGITDDTAAIQASINHVYAHVPKEPQSRYIAILTGKGEGCDYTIGCNRTTIEISGSSLEEAERNLVQHINEEYSGFSGLQREYSDFNIRLVEVAQSKVIDFHAYVAQEEREEQQEKQRETEERERAEYERLKARFEQEKL